MRIRFSTDLIKDLKKIKKKNRVLIQLIEKQITLFKVNPKHPSLRLHKLSGKQKGTWSISINPSIRIVYILLNADEAYFIDIGTHDQIYKRN